MNTHIGSKESSNILPPPTDRHEGGSIFRLGGKDAAVVALTAVCKKSMQQVGPLCSLCQIFLD